jgi:hypothetical protein
MHEPTDQLLAHLSPDRNKISTGLPAFVDFQGQNYHNKPVAIEIPLNAELASCRGIPVH